jgi:hypothetical protein
MIGCSPAPSATGGDTPASSQQGSGGWETYADPDGDSSVAAYEIGDDYIRVQFTDGSIYLYTYASAGSSDIERMKELARAGDGLNSYIMRNAKYDYESKQ